ncbi:hypothetical protein Q1695_014067 [Nippostrongylus brasiliensis]|nr:hypothetical protein Q1695_014067 [Nippostrongylus brasiliensis]
MTSLLGGNSILHIANRLGGLKKEVSTEGLDSESVAPSPTPPPPSFRPTGVGATFPEVPPVSESPAPPPPPPAPQSDDSAAMVMSLFKDKDAFSTSPSTSESAACGGDASSFISTHIDLNTALSHMQQQITAAAAAQHQQQPPQHSSGQQNDGKVSELLPGYSPWMRNAGRKKSHPVWEFFKDLKDTNGVGGVVCLHCSWQGDDRSPNNLRTHLKKFHSSDGVFARFSEKLAQILNPLPGCFAPDPRAIDSRSTTTPVAAPRPPSNLELETPLPHYSFRRPAPSTSQPLGPPAIDSRPTLWTPRPPCAGPRPPCLAVFVSFSSTLHHNACCLGPVVAAVLSAVPVFSSGGFPRLSVFDGRSPADDGAPHPVLLLQPIFNRGPAAAKTRYQRLDRLLIAGLLLFFPTDYRTFKPCSSYFGNKTVWALLICLVSIIVAQLF